MLCQALHLVAPLPLLAAPPPIPLHLTAVPLTLPAIPLPPCNSLPLPPVPLPTNNSSTSYYNSSIPLPAIPLPLPAVPLSLAAVPLPLTAVPVATSRCTTLTTITLIFVITHYNRCYHHQHSYQTGSIANARAKSFNFFLGAKVFGMAKVDNC